MLFCQYLQLCTLVLWFHILQSGLHWVHWAITMAPKEHKISTHTVAGTTRDMIWTILDTLEIVRKPGSATNSTVYALEIGLAFRRHPADKDYFLHGHKNILSYSLQLLTDLPNFLTPPSPQKKSHKPFSFPTVHLFAVAVYMDKTKTTDISRYSCNGSNNRHVDI